MTTKAPAEYSTDELPLFPIEASCEFRAASAAGHFTHGQFIKRGGNVSFPVFQRGSPQEPGTRASLPPSHCLHEMALRLTGPGLPILDNLFGACHFSNVVTDKYQRLRSLLESYGSCLVAYSGGVDSVFLAYVARDVLGSKALAAIADSPSLPRREFDDALALAEQFKFPVRVVRTKEFDNANYLSNPNNRCYFCKHELFTELEPLARAEGFSVLAYGENASDVGDFRPGATAAAEFQVRAPLKEAGLTKAEIRELSSRLGLPTADKPQMACLSSRIPYGEPVSPEKLRMIEAAENVLRDLGFYDVRVRHHELGSGSKTASAPASSAVPSEGVRSPLLHLARIEVGPSELPKFLVNGASLKIAEALKQVGYAHVTLDLQGYRRGSTNEVLKQTSK